MALKSVLFGLAAAAGNLAGAIAVVRHQRRSLTLIETCLAFGAGFMMALVLVGVLPEVFGGSAPDASAGGLVLVGYVLVHLTQHAVTPHFHFGEETHAVKPGAGQSALVGLLLHSVFDGVAIATGFLVSFGLGALFFLAVLLHKLPEGVTIASLMLAGGATPRRAVWAGAALGFATIAGVLLTDLLASLARHGLALAAGVTLYVAASNLVPEFQATKSLRMTAAFLGGAAALLLLRLLGSASL